MYHPDSLDSYSNSGDTRLNSLLHSIERNPLTDTIREEAIERFWVMFIVDTLLYNNDRNNGNWGILVGEKISLAPVFDNGNSFNNKFSDQEMESRMDKIDDLQCKRINSIFLDDEDCNIIPYDFFQTHTIEALNQAIEQIVPISDLDKIYHIIDELPNMVEEITVASEIAKNFIKKGIEARYRLILEPALRKIQSSGS